MNETGLTTGEQAAVIATASVAGAINGVIGGLLVGGIAGLVVSGLRAAKGRRSSRRR